MREYEIFDPQIVVAGVAQRLVREVCPHCARRWPDVETELPEGLRHRLLKLFADRPGLLHRIRFRNHDGCTAEAKAAHKEKCTRGYRGRTLVAEIMMTDEQLMHLAKHDKVNEAIAYWEEHLDGVSMVEHAWYKVVKGLCDPSDVETAVGDLDIVRPERFERIVELSDDSEMSLFDLEHEGLST